METKKPRRVEFYWKIIGFLTRVSDCLWRRLMNLYHRNAAESLTNNRHCLTAAQKREIKDFWKPYWKIDTTYHNFYTEKTGVFSPEYIPDDLFCSIIDPRLNNNKKAVYIDDKCLYRVLLKDIGIKMPETICYRVERVTFGGDGQPVDMPGAIRMIAGEGRAFIKRARESCGGKGVVVYDKDRMNPEELAKAVRQLGYNWVAQKCIRQSPVLSALNPNSVNTLRVITYLQPDGNVLVLPAVLRMSANSACVDNAASGGISVGVLPDGRLKDKAIKKSGETFDVHPLTGVRFSDVTIPGFPSIMEKLRTAQLRFPYFRFIGWDIALDENNEPVLVELNTRPAIYLIQLNHGPLFGDHVREALDDIFETKTSTKK